MHRGGAGADVRMIRMETDRIGGTTYSFANINAFLQNNPSNVQYVGNLSDPSVFNAGASGPRHIEQQYYVGFAQDVDAFAVLPNSTGVIYRADQNTDGVSELYRVLFVTAPVTDRLVNPPLVVGQNVGVFAVTPDSANVIYIANRPLVSGANQLFVVLAGGGANIQLNGVLVVNGNVTSFAVTPDGLSVVYRADQDIDEVFELYRTVIAAAPAIIVLSNTPAVYVRPPG